MKHYKQILIEDKLKKICDLVDDVLEDNYGDSFRLHPNRSKRGEAANKAYDGLFNITASFTAGYGSDLGRGYVLDLNLVTLENVPGEFLDRITREVKDLIAEELKRVFPDREMKIAIEENILKITGDFHLGLVNKREF
jgi:hypothetical protein